MQRRDEETAEELLKASHCHEGNVLASFCSIHDLADLHVSYTHLHKSYHDSSKATAAAKDLASCHGVSASATLPTANPTTF